MMTKPISEGALQAYRERTFRHSAKLRLRSLEDALAFVEQRGFITFWPIKGIDLPSLWGAVAGDRPVAAEHDDPGHVSWGWKDEMLDKRKWYYGKLLRGKATLVSLTTIPYFYALSERVAELDDFRLPYEDGHLSHAAYQVAQALYQHGSQHTIQLRRLAHLSASGSKARFDKALTDLQRGLWVIPVGIARAGSWRYAFVYELFDRWFTNVPIQARKIPRSQARAHLARLYLESVGVSDPQAITRLFGWRSAQTHTTLEYLAQEGHANLLEEGRWVTAKLAK